MMDLQTAKRLIDATNDFYIAQCESFSQTRQRPWDGWTKLLPYVKELGPQIKVLDIGCGNLRFEKYLSAELPSAQIEAFAIDSCVPLARLGDDFCDDGFKQIDVIDELSRNQLLNSLQKSCTPCDLSVAFGFIHHIPIYEWRLRFLENLVQMTEKGGIICVSFWQPGKSEKLLAKMRDVTPLGCEALGIKAPLGQGDYLLDWQQDNSVFRYVHDTSDDEINALVEAACEYGAILENEYVADGKSNDLNRYVILKRDVD